MHEEGMLDNTKISSFVKNFHQMLTKKVGMRFVFKIRGKMLSFGFTCVTGQNLGWSPSWLKNLLDVFFLLLFLLGYFVYGDLLIQDLDYGFNFVSYLIVYSNFRFIRCTESVSVWSNFSCVFFVFGSGTTYANHSNVG